MAARAGVSVIVGVFPPDRKRLPAHPVVDRARFAGYHPSHLHNPTRADRRTLRTPERGLLIGKTRTVRGRVTVILGATAAVTAAGILAAAGGAAAGLWAWPPQSSSPLGVTLGLVAAVIVLFEMALLPRKWLRGKRLGATRVWMRWHIWLGIACLPVVLVHAGFAFGGPLTTATLALFLGVTASGVWGLLMQQWLPQKLLEEVSGETVASQIDFLGEYHAAEATRLVDALVTVPAESGTTDPPVTGPPARELVAFRDDLLLPYLRNGGRVRSPLASRTEADQRFARLRDIVPEVARLALDRLRDLAEMRRQWDAQARVQFWLHNWLVLHLPLSVAMTVLMVVHAVGALKYW
jgi:hypothetical protein